MIISFDSKNRKEKTANLKISQRIEIHGLAIGANHFHGRRIGVKII